MQVDALHHSRLLAATREYLLASLGDQRGDLAFRTILGIKSRQGQIDWAKTIVEDMEFRRLGKVGISPIERRRLYKYPPISVKEFVEDPYYLNAKGILYPEILACMEEMNNGEYQEAVLTGGIGVGKTTAALYGVAYQLYLLSCYKDPHKLFGLDPNSEIVFVFQSLNASLAKTVDFQRFKSMIEKSPYFREKFPFNKDLLSEMHFPNRIIVKPISGQETGAIGQNVIGGLVDEINFMIVVENSKQSAGGGTYDQAEALYGSIRSRRKSRFMKQGKLPGMLYLVSSKRFPGQFTDRKAEEARTEMEMYGKTSIYIYDKRLWEVKPPGSFSDKWFRIFIGDDSRKPRILDPDEVVPEKDSHLVDRIPEDYRMEFETRMLDSLREIAGISTMATHPFIPDKEAISKCMRNDSIMFSQDVVDFVTSKLNITKSKIIKPDLPRFVHIDLAVSGDSAGVCVGTVLDFKSIQRGDTIEVLPNIWIDGLLEVAPPKGGEIQFYKIREIIYALKKMGMNIRWVTFDQFQSVDSMQVLKQAGYIVGRQSVDITTGPYDMVKNAIYDGRLDMPKHAKVLRELSTLEKDTKKNKIDHPAHSSKDVSDALAGVVWGLTTRREIWALHNVNMVHIPESIKKAIKGDQ